MKRLKPTTTKTNEHSIPTIPSTNLLDMDASSLLREWT
jgi:hypothetical protein